MNIVYKRTAAIFLFLLLFAGLYFILRLPLADESLYFEEGIFAELMVHRPCGPQYDLGSRIDGINFYSRISHPALSYELLRLGGWLGQSLLKDPVYLDDTVVTPRLRMLCSGYQFILWTVILIFLFLSRSLPGKWKYVILCIAAFSPLALKTSVLLQTDNTTGVLFCGMAALLILLAQVSESGRLRFGLLLAAGCIAGLGKQEWSMALLTALLVIFLVQCVMRMKAEMVYSSIIFVGLIIGNGISYLFDPINYTSAFHFMSAFSGLSQSSPQPWQMERWWKLVKSELPFIYICFILQAIFILSIYVTRERGILKYVLFVYGIILFYSYLIINWNNELRYFMPSLAVLTLACIAAIPSLPPSWYTKTVGLLAATVLLTSIGFLFFFKPNRNIELEQIQSGLLKSTENTILFVNSGAVWNKPHIDYINRTNGYESAKQLAKKYGKELVVP